MVLIDTSIFVNLYRRRDKHLGDRLMDLIARDEACICGPVWIEFIGGFRSSVRRAASIDRLRAFRWLATSIEAYELAATWFGDYGGIGPMDALIAATAAVNGASLLTKDRGFLPLRSQGLDVMLSE